MSRSSVVSHWSERIAEACWLLGLTLIPLYFNLYSARHFEPDKAAFVRSLALVALAALVVRALDGMLARSQARPAVPATPDPTETAQPPPPPLWRRLLALPLALPTLLYALVFLFATAISVVPATSFWGSYQRMQGTYSNLSYIMLFVAIVAVVRRRAQIERIITISLATGVAVAGYGIMQHFQLDPLPWRGDVIARVASTMGNAIFVAAYLILVVPLAIYRLLAAASEARNATPAGPLASREWLWALTNGLIFAAGLMLLLAFLKFGAVIRVADMRYWWVLPGAISTATAIWWLLTIGLGRPEGRIPAWPGLLTLGYLLVFGLQFAFSGSSGAQVLATDGTSARAQDWWIWLLLAITALSVAYGLAFNLPRRLAAPSRLGLILEASGAGLISLMLLVAIFFSQSRGPWIGLGSGLMLFFSLVLLQARAHARAAGLVSRTRRMSILLYSWAGLIVATIAFLIAFNLSDAPFFERLRQVPYVGRMGQLLAVQEGTGLVRSLIWVGDEYAGGAVALITSDPVRAVIGWGPESMFVAFNPFYPPSLANIEARGASPDRSHQALLDELVTKGLFGLISYFFLLFSFVTLSWRLMRNSEEWRWQIFFIACLSAVTANVVEGLTGIPIVSTLMMFWILLGLTVTGGAVAGHYRLTLAPEPAHAATPVAAPHVAKAAPNNRRRSTPRGAVVRGAARPASSSDNGGVGAMLLYGLVALITLTAIWVTNANPIFADMRFQQGQTYSESTANSSEGTLRSLEVYLDTVRLNPREDFYYLNLGRVLMSLAESLRAQGIDPGVALPDPQLGDLLRIDKPGEITGFVQRTPPNALMSYAEAVLFQAYELNPRNKDHYANLGRINTFWYQWDRNPERLREASSWYEQVTPIAPQDVTLLNERAAVLIQLGEEARAANDSAQASVYFDQARSLLTRSAELDSNYSDTFVRLGDLARSYDGDLDAAVTAYEQAIALAGPTVANSIENIAGALAGRPELILRLRDAYARLATDQEQRLADRLAANPGYDASAEQNELALLHTVAGLLTVRSGVISDSVEDYRRALELQPTNPVYSRNYAIVLSETLRHAEAISETQRMLALLQAQPEAAQAISDAEQLIAIFQAAAAQHASP